MTFNALSYEFTWWILSLTENWITMMPTLLSLAAELVIIMKASTATNDTKVGMMVSHSLLVSPGEARQYELMSALHVAQSSTLRAYWKRDCSPTHELDNIIVNWVLTHCGLVTIWQHISVSSLAQVMTCCLMAPSHYMNQCWLIIKSFLCHSHKSHFIGSTPDIGL